MDLPPTTNFEAALELFYYGEATYYITVSLTKISILFLYLKLIPQRTYRHISWGMMVFVGLTGFTCVIAGIFQCNPIPKAWHPKMEGTCFNQVALYLSNAGLNIFQDLIIYFLPVKTLWQVQLPLKQRIALIAVFVVGAFVCLTGILRLESLTMASVSPDQTCKSLLSSAPLNASQDPLPLTWHDAGDNYGAAIWSSIEANVGIVCASLVHLKPLIARYAPGLLSIQRTTRLPDERSDGTGKESKLRSTGWSSNKSSNSRHKPFGILTEMEREDKREAATSRAGVMTATTHKDGSDHSSDESEGRRPVTPRDMSGQSSSGIHKMTHVSISYADRDPERGF